MTYVTSSSATVYAGDLTHKKHIFQGLFKRWIPHPELPTPRVGYEAPSTTKIDSGKEEVGGLDHVRNEGSIAPPM